MNDRMCKARGRRGKRRGKRRGGDERKRLKRVTLGSKVVNLRKQVIKKQKIMKTRLFSLIVMLMALVTGVRAEQEADGTSNSGQTWVITSEGEALTLKIEGTGEFEQNDEDGYMDYKESVSTVVFDVSGKLTKGAFSNFSSLERVEISGNVSEIQEGAFDDCKQLKTVYLLGSSKVAAGAASAFTNEKMNVYVAQDLVGEYKQDQEWGAFNVAAWYNISYCTEINDEYRDLKAIAAEGEAVKVPALTFGEDFERSTWVSVVDAAGNTLRKGIANVNEDYSYYEFEMPGASVAVNVDKMYSLDFDEEVDGNVLENTVFLRKVDEEWKKEYWAVEDDSVKIVSVSEDGASIDYNEGAIDMFYIDEEGSTVSFSIDAKGGFKMPKGDVLFTKVNFIAPGKIKLEYDTKLGTIRCPETAYKGALVDLDVKETDFVEGYGLGLIFVNGERLKRGVDFFRMPEGEEGTVQVTFRKLLSSKETGALTVSTKTAAGLTNILTTLSKDESQYDDDAAVKIEGNIEGAGSDINLEEQTDESIKKEAVALSTIGTLKGSIDGQGNSIKNMVAQMTGLVDKIDEQAAVSDLVMESTTIYVDPTDPAWTVEDNNIYVHIVAKKNEGAVSNFGFAGKVVVDESKVPEGMNVVICLVSENNGDVNGFYYDTDLEQEPGNKRCITIKQNIGCAKNGGRAKVATSKAGNKSLRKPTYDEAEVNKMDRQFTAAEFASGEVAYWLNWTDRGYTGEYKPIWRQGEKYPELAIDVDGVSNGLYKIEYTVNDESKIVDNPVFANNGDKVTIKYKERPISIKNGDEVTEIGDESATFVYNANKSIEIEFAETTAAKEVGVEEADSAWYDLMGRQQNGKPSAKGVYVHGGKKVIVK